ncbi:MAG: alpha/beta hydrolase [Chloroflexota bacterium]
MPRIPIDGLDIHCEQIGEGAPLVFIHGAFADTRMWDPQWQHFATKYQLLRYDLRGHGKTGPSILDHYTIETFADDLAALLDALGVGTVALCGQSFGGSIAQAFAIRHQERVRALVLAGSMVAVDLSLMDKLLCRLFFPEWAMTTTIKLLSVEKFTRFSLWLGRLTKGKQFLSTDENTTKYLEQCMFQMDSNEYLKFWRALYAFKLLPLERITCPTLILNGEYEPKSMLPHTLELLRLIPHAEAKIVPAAHHASNMDNPKIFNALVDDFLRRAG